MSRHRIREISLPDGKKVEGEEMDFDIVEENWNEYRLKDGTRVRVKNVVARIFRIMDEDGNPKHDQRGDPIVAIVGNMNVSAISSEED